MRPFNCLTKLSAKRVELVQKFVPRSRVRIFRNEHTRLTPLGPKLMFWCVPYYLGAFGTVSLPYQTPCKTGRSGAKVCAMKSCRNFLKRTFSIHPIGPQPHVSERFVLLGCIWDSLVALRHSVQNGPKCCKSSCHEIESEFFAMNTLDPPHWILNTYFGVFCTIWVHFGLFGCLTKLRAKPAEVVQKFVP